MPENKTDNTIIECRNLSRSFRVRDRNIHVLEGINFSVCKGDTVIITGRSGEGKSVLLWLLSGLDRPSSGDIFFEGKPFSSFFNSELAKLRRDKIGIIFQNFNLVSSWTARENVESAMVGNSLSLSEKRSKSADVLARLGLSDRMDSLPFELSIGQQQRVAIARTLVNEPVLIIADEPTGDVDPETAAEILEMLTSAVIEKGSTLILATHGNPPIANADKIFNLKNRSIKLLED